MSKSTNSHGNDTRGVMKFLRENGIKPNVANVERIGKELRRTESQNERVEKIHREMERERGIPSTRDEKGDVHARVRNIVRRDLDRRGR